MQARVETTSSTSGALLLSVGADQLDCGDPFNHAPHVTTVDAINLTGGKTVTLTVSKQFDMTQPNNGAAHYQVCFEGEQPFRDRDGNIVMTGLLADCGVAAAPCVASRSKSQGASVEIVIELPPGDPRMV